MMKLLKHAASFIATTTAMCVISSSAVDGLPLRASKVYDRALEPDNAFTLNLGNKRLEGTHALTAKDVAEFGITGGSGKFVLVTEFFYGGVYLVDVEEQTFEQIVPSGEWLEKGGVGLTASDGHIFVAASGPNVLLPFEIYVYNPQGELVNTCLPPSGVQAGIFNDIAVVGDVAYVTDSSFPRLWNFNIPDAIDGNCVLEFQELDDVFDPVVQETPIESNGIVPVGDGFIIAQFGSGGLYYANPKTGITAEVVPTGTYNEADGLELVEEGDGTLTLYVTVGVTNNIYVYKVLHQAGCEIPALSFVSKIENEGYDGPSTSAVLGDMIYTANLRGQALPLLSVPFENNTAVFTEQFSLVGTSRLVGDSCKIKGMKGKKADKKTDKKAKKNKSN